jgi:hypothetical protein
MKTMSFEPVDRLPVVEWASWWDKTLARWHTEGLPVHLSERNGSALQEFFGLDIHEQYWISPYAPDFPAAGEDGRGPIATMEDYTRLRDSLYPKTAFDRGRVEAWAARHDRGEIVVWITLEGFFWFPRALLGINEHFYAFYDKPDLMHAMNQDLVDYHLRAIDEFCAICTPDFMTFAEDMSYNNGPMISRDLFESFMVPYYKQILPKLKEHDIIPIIDSDGNIERLIPWFLDIGIDGFLPMEKQAGFDIVKVRQQYPRTRFIGGYDKMVMSKTEKEMRAEFERIMPVMKQGGYIPSCDHQTPPEVSLENYRMYVQLLKEYASGTI